MIYINLMDMIGNLPVACLSLNVIGLT